MKNLSYSALLLCLANSLSFGQISLLKDINQTSTTDGGNPTYMTEMNGAIYFVAYNSPTGQELYKTIIATNVTTLVKDIAIGPNSSGIIKPIVMNMPTEGNVLFFAATDGIHGNELWRSDGTAAGTVMVKDLNVGSGTGVNANFYDPLLIMNGSLFFSGNDGTTGDELWKSDGTANGTVLIKDINTSGNSNPASFIEVNGTIFFTANNGTSSVELWTTDGTVGNAIMQEIYPGSDPGFPQSLVAMGSNVYFSADDGIHGRELWKSNGVNSTLVKDIQSGAGGSNPTKITVFGSSLIFSAGDGVHSGTEVYISTGATGNATLLKIIDAAFGSTPEDFTVVGSTCYFTAVSFNDYGRELWSTDGTEAGTNLVKDIRSGNYNANGSGYWHLTAFAGTLFFSADDGVHGAELWKTNGTQIGTVMVADINEVPTLFNWTDSSLPQNFAVVSSTLFFTANNGNGFELWKTNGTTVSKVVDIRSGTNSSFANNGSLQESDFFNIGSTMYFRTNDGTSGIELWKSNGTAATTVLVKDLYPGLESGDPLFLTDWNGTLYFTAKNGINGYELWKTDGTTIGTVMVADINSGANGSSPTSATVLGSSLLFAANDGVNGTELWKTDGTESGTVMVADIYPGATGSNLGTRLYSGMKVLGGFAYFTADDGVNGPELWRTDGTTVNTAMVKNIQTGSGLSTIYNLEILNNQLLFGVDDGVNGYELWKSDGSIGNASMVKNIHPSAGSAYQFYFGIFNNHLYFDADDGVSGRELWKSDGTEAGTVLVKDITPGASGSSPRSFVVANGLLIFSANDGITGVETWRSDGTAAGTSLVKDIANLTNGSGTQYYQTFDDKVFFLASDETDLNIWVTDGRPNGTIKIPLSNAASPRVLVRSATKIYTTFIGLGVDREAYILDPALVILDPKSQASNLSFTNNSVSGYTVSWSAAQGPPAGYLVIRKTGSSPTGVPVDGVVYNSGDVFGDGTIVFSGAGLTFNESTLAAGTSYFYDIYSYNGTGSSINYLIVDSPLENSQSTLLAAPVAVAATSPSQSAFTANWNTTTGATSYRLDVSSDNFLTFVTGFQDVTVSGTTQLVNNLAAGTTYSYRVRAVNTGGTTANSNTIAQLTLPANPVISISVPTVNGFTLTWPPIPSATSYVVEVSKSTSFALIDLTNSAATSPLIISDGSKISGATVYYTRVRAVNATGNSGDSNMSTVLTLPDAPNLLAAANISGTSFKADWDPSSGTVNGYKLEISTDNFVTFLTGYNPKTLNSTTTEETTNNLTANTVYQYRVRAFNDSGESANSTIRTVQTTSNTNSPLVFSTPVVAGFKISVTLSAGSGTRIVKFYSKGIVAANNAFVEKTLTSTTDAYETTVAETDLDELGLEYYFTAQDASITSAIETTHGFLYKSIGTTATTAIPFSANMDGKSATYEMFSVPYVINDKNIGSIFDELGGSDKTKWRLFRYQGGKYIEYPDNITNIDLGKGYWFNSIDKVDIKPGEGEVTKSNQTTAFTITLEAGWNQIGNPYPFNIDWSKIKSANTGLNSLFLFEGGKYVKKDVLAVWKGAFVFSDVAGTVSFPVTAKTSSTGRTNVQELHPNIDEASWQLPITLSLNGLEQISAIGMHPEAKTSKDKFDEITIPRFLDYLEMDTYHEEFFAHNFASDVVPTTKASSWLFTVSSNQKEGEATLSWNQQALLNTESKLGLLDLQSQTLVDMKTTSHYRFNWSEGRQFKILYSKEGELLPGVTLLGNAYPNPFNSGVTIPFMLEQDQTNVEVSVYDLLGRRVKTISKTNIKAGIHSLEWNGSNEQGTSVESGLYLYQLRGDKGIVSAPKRLVKQ